MLRLRSLVFVALVLLCQMGKAQVANGVQYTMTTQSLNGLTGAQNLNPSYNTNSISEQILGNAKISKSLSAEIGLSSYQKDYSSIVLLEKNGQSQNLGALFNQPEYLGLLQLSFSKGSHILEVSENSSLSASPYAQNSHSLRYTFRGPYDQYKIGTSLNQTLMAQPLGYFVARDFSTQQRPENLDALNQTLWLEYVLGEDLKIRGTLIHGSRREDRPDNVGEEIRLAYAINPHFSSRFSLENIQELNSSLLDERGRFGSRSADSELTWLVNYRTSIRFGYGLLLEEESEKFDGSTDKIGHDIYSLGAEFKVADLLISSSLFYQATSQQTTEFAFQGGVQWEL